MLEGRGLSHEPGWGWADHQPCSGEGSSQFPWAALGTRQRDQVPQACSAIHPTPTQGEERPPLSLLPRALPRLLSSTSRSYLTHPPRLCHSLSLTRTFSLPPLTLPLSLG